MSSEPTTLAVPIAALEPAVKRQSGLQTLLLYSAGHFAVDVYSAALGVYQPMFARHLGITLTQAGILGGMMVFAGSVMQPFYGYLSDRFHSRLFSVLAPGIAALFISCLGIAPSFPWLLAMLFLGASAVASFHPQSSVRAVAGISEGRGKAMALFISSGQLGYALGPVYFATILTTAGFHQSYWAAIPGVLVTIGLLAYVREPARIATGKKSVDFSVLKPVWKPFLTLYMIVFLRSVLTISFTQFLPLYLTRERGFSYTAASWTVTAYSALGAFGAFFGGHLSDRFGGRIVTLVTMIGAVPFLFAFFQLNGVAALFSLAVGGLILLSTNPVNIVMAQNLAPGQSGTISALMMGFAWGMAGLIFIPMAGAAADHYGLHAVLRTLVIFPLIGFLLAFRLPK